MATQLTEEQISSISSNLSSGLVKLADASQNGEISAKELDDLLVQFLSNTLGSIETATKGESGLSISIDTNVPELTGTTFTSIKQGATELSIQNLRKNIELKLQNIQAMFNSLPDVYAQLGHKHSASAIISGQLDIDRVPNLPAEKITSGVLNRPVTTNDDVIRVKNSKVNVDAAINHASGAYFGISEEVDISAYTIRDNDDYIIGGLKAKLSPDGTITISIVNSNPQPGNGNTATSDINLTTNKSGQASFYWKNLKFIAKDDKIVSHSLTTPFIGIQSGTAEINVGKEQTQKITINFGKDIAAFTKAPVLTVSPLVQEKYCADISIAITSISKTSAEVVIKNKNQSDTISGTLQWVAVRSDGDNLEFA